MKTILKILGGVSVLAAVMLAAASTPAATVRAAGTATVTMPADRFVPFAQTVNAGDTVTWQNKDTDLHTVVSVPGNAPEALNLTVKSGATGSFAFTKPGVYWYYCNVHAKWDAEKNQVEALPTVDNPAEPMEGAILVLGAGQAAAPAQVVAPGDLFNPVITTVTAGAAITWQNNDTDLHTVTSVPNNAPAAIDLTVKAGASASMTFTTPGLYWYYCKVHATWDAEAGQVAANPTSDYPSEPMMGLVAVLPAASAATPTASPTVAAPTPQATAPTQAPSVAPAPPKTGSGSAGSSPFSTDLLLVIASLLAAFGLAVSWLTLRNQRSAHTK